MVEESGMIESKINNFMSHKENDKYLEELQEVEQDLKDAEEEREKAIQELSQAINWFQRMDAKVGMERLNLKALKEKE